MSESHSVYKIDPLKGAENYPTWKIKMIDILTDLDLIEYADGTKKVPADAAAKTTWSKSDRKALSTIRLRVSDGPLVYISGLKTSAEAWKALKDMYEKKGPIGIVMTRRKFFRAQCEEGGDIEEHIRTLRSYQEELAALDHAVEGRGLFYYSAYILTRVMECIYFLNRHCRFEGPLQIDCKSTSGGYTAEGQDFQWRYRACGMIP